MCWVSAEGGLACSLVSNLTVTWTLRPPDNFDLTSEWGSDRQRAVKREKQAQTGVVWSPWGRSVEE